MTTKLAWISVAGTILFTIYGQIVTKWRVRDIVLPDPFMAKIWTLCHVLIDPWVFSALASAVVAALFWISAMTKLPLSLAYPFTCVSFVIVAALSTIIWHEPFTASKITGIGLVIVGLIVLARG